MNRDTNHLGSKIPAKRKGKRTSGGKEILNLEGYGAPFDEPLKGWTQPDKLINKQ